MIWAIGIVYVLGWIASSSYGIYWNAKEYGRPSRMSYGGGIDEMMFIFLGMFWPLLFVIGPIGYIVRRLKEAGYKAHDDPMAKVARDKENAAS